jgi:hypothetical protein
MRNLGTDRYLNEHGTRRSRSIDDLRELLWPSGFLVSEWRVVVDDYPTPPFAATSCLVAHRPSSAARETTTSKMS